MLKIQQLRVSYGGIQALRGIDLEVPDGKIVTLIGANGAGKSTTLRTISGLVKAESGSIQWNGEELLGKPIDKIISAGIAMSPEGRRVFADLTVLENLKLGAYLRKDKAEIEKDLKWVYELVPRLEERNWQSAGTLSGAPKIRACQLIGELEGNKRGIYGGAIGYIDFTGNVDTCIAIRIAYKKNGQVFIRSGAGIVADSVPDKEYEECINKARAVVNALELAQGVDQ